MSNFRRCRSKSVRLGRHLHHAATTAVVACMFGCDAYDNSFSRSPVRNVAKQLDKVAARLEEFGAVSMSSPLLIPASDQKVAPFAFDLNRDANAFFADAQTNTQGAAARLVESQSAAGLAVRGQFDLTAIAHAPVVEGQYVSNLQRFDQRQTFLAQSARAQYDADRAAIDRTLPQAQQDAADALARKKMFDALAALGPTEEPSPPESTPSEKLPGNTLEPPAAKTGAISTTFQGVRGLLPSGVDPKLSGRTALNIAAGDVASKGMFSVLGDPTKFNAGMDGTKKLLFGVTMVSVEPGWRTQKDYVGEVSVRASFYFRPARRELIKDAFKHPARYSKNPDELRALIVEGLDRQEQSSILGLDENAAKKAAALGNIRLGGMSSSRYQSLMESSAEPVSSAAAVAASGIGIPDDVNADGASVPLVAAVSPMSDVQTLDLSDAIRRRVELALDIALALSAQGAGGQANAFLSYAKQVQADVRTRSALPVVTSYSNSGGSFGFRMGPSVRGTVVGKEQREAGANILERQTFPALVLVAMDSADLGLRVRRRLGRIELVEPCLRFDQSARWAPITRDGIRLSEVERMRGAIRVDNSDLPEVIDSAERDRSLFELMELGRLWRDVGGQTEATLRATLRLLDSSDHRGHEARLRQGLLRTLAKDTADLDLVSVHDLARDLIKRQISQFDELDDSTLDNAQLLRQRAFMLKQQTIGSWSAQAMPLDFLKKPDPSPPTPPTITQVVPTQIDYDPAKPTTRAIAVTGKGLKGAVIEIAGIATTMDPTSSATTLIATLTTPTDVAATRLLSVKDKDGALIFASELAFSAPKPRAVVQHDRQDGDKATVDVFSAEAGDRDLIKPLIDASIPRCCPATKPSQGEDAGKATTGGCK